MKNHENDLANNVTADAIANLEPESHHVTESLRHRAMVDDLQSLAERIASSRNLQVRLAHEVASCREKIFRTQTATRLSVTCSPGAGDLLRLQAMVDVELARRAIECAGLG
jgi:hypothetical protein